MSMPLRLPPESKVLKVVKKVDEAHKMLGGGDATLKVSLHQG